MGNRIIRILQIRDSSFALCCDWETAAIAESLGRNLDAGRCLLTFVFGAIDHADDAPDEFDIQATIRGNLFSGVGVFHVIFEHRVEDFVRRRLRLAPRPVPPPQDPTEGSTEDLS